MTLDEAEQRLVTIAREHDGLIVAADVEADPDLAGDQPTARAAAHALAGSTNAFGTPREDDGRGWFPYAEIRLTALRRDA